MATDPPPWPAASLAQIEAMLCGPGQPFEMEMVSIADVATPSWKNAPPSLPALARLARAAHGQRTFIVYEDERVSYAGWFRAAAALAAHLEGLGIRRGDRVALAMRNLPEWPVAFFATVSLGAIVVPLNAWWTGAELQYGLTKSGTSLLICDAERWDRIRPCQPALPDLRHVLVARADGRLAAPAAALEAAIGTPHHYAALPDRDLPAIPIAPDDDATIFFTSGTTGKPKGALGTHRNILTCVLAAAYTNARTCLRRGEMPPEPEPKTILTVIPMFHVTACNSTLMGTLAAGHTIVFMRRWNVTDGLALIERERINITGGVPTIAWQILEHPDRARYDLSSLETIAYGGAPSAPELVRRIQCDLGAAPNNGWGMTETSATVTSHGAEDYLHRPDSCGPPLPVSRLKVMSDDATRELPVGEVGELWAAGPQIVKGYWDDPEATARTFVDGWVRTGDMARIDEEGFCFIVDRAKEVVIRAGENIYSTEVENVLYAHPAVTDAAVIGIPHRTLGEEPAAVVHLAPGADASEAELQDWVRARLAGFKVPVRIVFRDGMLPRNANGKILKKELAELFADETVAG
jgi:acyl-CoA synthetase (AMP-forming)/AMP-acid ligase II